MYKGISADNDVRYTNAERKLLSRKFPVVYDTKVDMTKVNLDIMRPWITKRVTELLGFEDEVVIEMIVSMLEEKSPDPRKCQINLTGFLEQNSVVFVTELWKLLVSAQESPAGIPATFVEEKQQEIRRRMERERRRPRSRSPRRTSRR